MLEQVVQERENLDKSIKDSNIQWGKLAARHGTMIEDFIHPSLERII
ncbi:MAG: hypothetical protein HQL03_05725 [Nitrospirae bacterium]|nr:hypothetical protein [Nitrospirota bacterium]